MNARDRRPGKEARSTRRGVRWAVSLSVAVGTGILWFLLVSSDGVMAGLQRGFAVAASGILNLLGQGTVADGSLILSDRFSISVVSACTGVFLSGIYVLAVLAFPCSWRAKFVGAAGGLIALVGINLIRLVSLYYVGVHWPGALDVVHQLVWQCLLIVAAVSLWLLWAGAASHRANGGAR